MGEERRPGARRGEVEERECAGLDSEWGDERVRAYACDSG